MPWYGARACVALTTMQSLQMGLAWHEPKTHQPSGWSALQLLPQAEGACDK